MENLIIEGQEDKPTILCDAKNGFMEIKGKSIPENPLKEIYEPIIKWLKEYAENPHHETVVNIKLDYFNTGSSKCLRDVFQILESLQVNNSSSVVINWYYDQDDEDMLNDGQDYQGKFEMSFKMIEIS